MMHLIKQKTVVRKIDGQPTIIPVLCVNYFMYIMRLHVIYIVHLGNIASIFTIMLHRCSDCDLFALVFDYVPTCMDTRLITLNVVLCLCQGCFQSRGRPHPAVLVADAALALSD